MCELCVALEHFEQQRSLFGRHNLTFLAGLCEVFTVLGIGIGVHLIAVSLAGLRQQDQRCGVSGLKAECEVEQDEWVFIEFCPTNNVDQNPYANNHRLNDKKNWRSKKPRERFRLLGKPVITVHGSEMKMWQMKTVVVAIF